MPGCIDAAVKSRPTVGQRTAPIFEDSIGGTPHVKGVAFRGGGPVQFDSG